jgi:hypothetical protein
MDIWREDIPDDLTQSPSRWLFEHFEEYADWMGTTQTYEQYYREHITVPENPVCPRNWYAVAEW